MLCDECGEVFPSQQEYDQHQDDPMHQDMADFNMLDDELLHVAEEDILCDECGQVFRSQHEYHQHPCREGHQDGTGMEIEEPEMEMEEQEMEIEQQERSPQQNK